MNRLIVILFCLIVFLPLCTEPATAAGKDELTLAGTYTNPNDGGASWIFTGEYLIGAGKYFVVGPSFTLFDGPGFDGNGLGVAAELNLTGLSGLFVGGAVHAVGGDAGEAIDYTSEARAGFKLGDGNGYCKLYVSRTWTQDSDGAVASPDRTDAVVALGLRF